MQAKIPLRFVGFPYNASCHSQFPLNVAFDGHEGMLRCDSNWFVGNLNTIRGEGEST